MKSGLGFTSGPNTVLSICAASVAAVLRFSACNVQKAHQNSVNTALAVAGNCTHYVSYTAFFWRGEGRGVKLTASQS